MFASRQSVGIQGIGQVTPYVGPVSPDVTAAYQAGLIVGAGGTSPLDLSNSTAEQQAAFNAGFNAAQAQPPLVTSGPNVGVQTGSVPLTVPPAAQPTPVITNTVVFAVAGIAALFLIIGMVRR